MFKGLHHFLIRKRIHKDHEPYPHPDRLKNAMDKLIYIIGICGPILSIPQIYNIWFLGYAAGVSVVTWLGFAFIGSFWIFYGVLHKNKPIIISHSLWVIVDLIVVVGVILN